MEFHENHTRSLGKETVYRLHRGIIRIYIFDAICQFECAPSNFLVLYGRISKIRSAAGNR